MKKLLVVVAVLVLAYPLAAWIMGFAIEARVDETLDDPQGPMAQLKLLHHERHGLLTSDDDATYALGANLKFERHYHRGWYSSTDDETISAQSSLARSLQPTALGGAAPPSGDHAVFIVHTDIHHGPVCGLRCFALARIDSKVDLAGPVGIALKKVFEGAAPLSVAGRLNFFGGGSGTFSSPAVSQVTLGQGAQLYWSGLEGTTHFGPHSDWYDLHLTAPRLRVHGAKGADFDLQQLTLDTHAKRALRSIYSSDATFGVGSFSATAPDAAAPVTMSDLQLAMRSEVQDRFMNVSYQAASGPMAAPHWMLSNTHLDFTFKHLELESLAKFMDALRSASQDQSVPPAARGAAMMSALKEPMEALLLTDPEWDIDRVSAANAQGQGLITGVIHLPGLTAADFNAPGGAAALLTKLDVRIDVTLDEAFLASLPGAADIDTKLQPMIDQGFLSRSAGALHTEIRMLEGRTTINGKAFNPGAFAPGALGTPGAPGAGVAPGVPPQPMQPMRPLQHLQPAPFVRPPVRQPGST
jgi:uncharacterized protein YdgA (DUF945 family)